MSHGEASERALVAVRWDESELDAARSERLHEDLVAAARQFGMLTPDVLSVVARAQERPGFALLVIDGTAFDVAPRGLAMAKRLWENLLNTFGEEVRIGVDVRTGATRTDAELEQLLDATPIGFVSLGARLVERLSEDEERDIVARRSSHGEVTYLFPAPRDAMTAAELGVLADKPARLPHRFVRRGADPVESRALTPVGLLDPSAVNRAEPLEAVLRAGSTVLVIGEPWVGKTYCARALYRHELRSRGDERAFFRDLRAAPTSLRTDLGWRAWRASDEAATLIVDGIDEAFFQGLRVDDVFDAVSALEPSQRARLRLIVFTRDDDSQDVAKGALRDPTVLRLLPIDAVEARRDLGAGGLGRALERSATLEGIPRPLSMEWLRTLADPSVALEEVPTQVLLRLCREGIDKDLGRTVPDSALLRVAERMAAALTFSSLEAVELDPTGLGVSVVASLLAGDDAEALRAFLRSAALVRRGSAYKFASRHTQELLAARAVRDLPEPVLRELLTDSAGRLRVELPDLARAIVDVAPHRRAAVERWRNAPLPALPEPAALALIDRIAALEAPRLPARVERERLARLDHGSVRARVKEHLRDQNRSLRVRETMLEIAHELGWSELVHDALDVALDVAENPGLRVSAAYFVAACGDAPQVDSMRPLSALRDAGQEDEQDLAAVAVRALLNRGLVAPLEAAAMAPLPQKGLVDARAVLLTAIKSRLAVEDAQAILGRSSGRLDNVAPVITEAMLHELVPSAIEKVAAEDVPWDEALASDVAAFVREDMLRKARVEPVLEQRLERDAHARQLLYRAMLGTRLHYLVRNTLTAEDAGWLLALAEASAEVSVRLAEDLNLLLWSLPDADAARAPIEALLSARFPERWAEWDEARRRAPEARARREEERRARVETQTSQPRRTLASAIDEVRAQVENPTQRLRLLARLCFAAEWSRYTNVDGSFDRLPREVREALIAEIRALLARADASDVPAGTSFSSSVVDDAAAFRAAVLWDDEAAWLTADLVRAWLPLVLFMHHEGDCTEVVRRCLHAQHETTVEVAVRSVARDARIAGYPFAAREAPLEIWTDRRFIAAVLRFVEDPEIALDAREPLLRLAASQAEPFDAVPALRRLAGSESDLRLPAIAALVALAPAKWMTLAEQVVVDVVTAARVFYVLIERHSELKSPDLDRVPTEPLLRLACILARHVSFQDAHPPGEPYSPTDEDDLRELRADVIYRLARRTDFDDPERLLACVAESEARASVRRRISWARDTGALERWLSELEIVAPRPRVERVIAALDGARALRIRSVEDLFEVLREGLETGAERDTFEYTELLRGVETQGSYRSWPHERSLQAYVLLRLREILALSHGHEDDLIHREVQEAAGADRLDFMLASVKTDVAPGATVELPVEVKWSHHAECVKSLTEQLGLRYVVDKGRTHGLYVVGFTGGDLAVLRAALEARRTDFEKKHRVKLGVVILPCVRPA